MFLTINKGHRAFSLVEVMFSVVLLSLLSLIAVMGMILHSRMAKSNIEQQRMAENSRRFIDEVQVEALDATIIRLDDGPSGPDTVLTLAKPDPANPANTKFYQFAYIDADGTTDTIEDNRIIKRYLDTPMATTGDEVVRYVTPMAPGIFSQDLRAGRDLFNINARVGDRTYPANNTDNRLTGIGTQMYRIAASVSTL